MVSGGTVNAAASEIKSSLESYLSTITGLSGSWQGASYDSISSKAEEFASSYGNAIASQMSSFASACDLYPQYEQTKASLASARSNYNSATEDGQKSSYSSQVSSLSSKLEQLKVQIEGLLGQAGGVALSDSGGNTSVSALGTEGGSESSADSTSITPGKSLGIAAGTYEYTFTSPTTGKQMKYYAYIPNNATEGMPLILYLHGDGSVNNMKALKDGEMTRFVSKIYGQDFPFIYIQPMTETTSWTKDGRDDTVVELTKSVAAEYKCDTNKIVLTGHSRGGNGSWSVANKYADMFSCFVPISGRATIDPSNLTNLPIVAVSSPHSSDSWNYNQMKNMVKQINAAGGNATFVSKNGSTHASVCKNTYTDEFFRWMISQTKGENKSVNEDDNKKKTSA